ncbi:MAG: hypothetical protein J2P52_14705 [Blastocatellia bacterium]|nr:hypothetical protein [Blastocatellia bacterium]
MINRVLFLLLAMSVPCFCSAPANAQRPEEEQGLRVNGVVVNFSLFAKGHAMNDGVNRIYSIEGNTIERTLINESTGVYVGYALQVERLESSTKLKISVKPLPQETIQRMRDSVWFKKFAQKWPDNGPTPLPRYPEPLIIDINDSLELTLFINPENGAQIGDRLRFEPDQPAPPRDFTLDEVALKLIDHRLFINGEARNGDKPFGGFTAPLPWFSVPGRGRFIFSIQPHEGYDFQKIGVIDGNKITFTHGGDKYEWVSSLPIINQRGKWNLWVLVDPNFEPGKQALDDTNLISKGNCCLYGAFSKPYQIGRAKE